MVLQVHIQFRIVADDDTVVRDDELLHLAKGDERLKDLGLSLTEARTLLERRLQGVIEAQAMGYLHRHRDCPVCGRSFRHKGRSATVFQTALGTVHLSSPRLHRCGCRPGNRKTFSPLTELFTEHTAPELLHLETKWASLVSYGMTAGLLKDVLPLGATLNGSTVRRHLHKVAARHDAELGDERTSFITGCPADWRDLPAPEGPIVVGIDGGYLHSWEDKKTNFEVIVGKSVPEDRDQRYFGLVQSQDTRPRRRLFEETRVCR